MAAMPNPIQSAMAQQLISRLAGGSPQAAGGGAPAAADGGGMLSKMFAENAGADPDMGLKTLKQMQGMLTALYPRFNLTVAGAGQDLANANKYIASAIEKLQKAAATVKTVAPIANNAGMGAPALMQPSSADTGV